MRPEVSLLDVFFCPEGDHTSLDANEVIQRFGRSQIQLRSQEKQQALTHALALILDLALELNHLIPDGREKSLVYTHLEEAAMWIPPAIRRSELSA